MKVKLLDTGENAIAQALLVTNADPELINPTHMDIDPDGYVTLSLQIWGEDRPREYSFHLDELPFSITSVTNPIMADHYSVEKGEWPKLSDISEALEQQRGKKNGD